MPNPEDLSQPSGDVVPGEQTCGSTAGRAATRKAWVLRIAWLVLAAVLVAAAGFAAWQLVGSNQLGRNAARDRVASFNAACQVDAQPSTGQGNVIALLRLPSLTEEVIPINSGVSHQQLAAGVGWYPSTAEPGALGNTALAGYRLTNGQPFAKLLDLRIGDRVVVETCRRVYTYEIVVAPADLVVASDAGWVLDGVPGEPGRLPNAKMITLTTSQDLLPTGDRAVGFGKLVSESDR